MKVLHLTLKKKWFDMIASGEKKEEYREMKQYWWTRLTSATSIGGGMRSFKKFDKVVFRNGYKRDAPTIEIECKEITIGHGNHKWGASGREVFIIKLGEILSTTGKPDFNNLQNI
jgi:hypothetical protein